MISTFDKYDLIIVLMHRRFVPQDRDVPVYQPVGVDHFHSQDQLNPDEKNSFCAEFSATQVEQVLSTIS